MPRMETRRLGRTEQRSSIAILGGAAFAFSEDGDPGARQAFEAALAHGVNHLDVAPRYGAAERVLGPWIPAVRHRLFVACKTARRAPDGVRAQLEASLALLGTDRFDLYQAHAVTDLATLDERRAAIEALFRARDEGLTRFVGITGHELSAPGTFVEALRRHDFDTVMFPVNPQLWSDRAYRADAEALLQICAARDLGVMAIKAVARRPWAAAEGASRAARFATTWYEPFTTPAGIERGLRFALSVPGVHACCTPGDLALLPAVLDVAARCAPMTAEEGRAAIASAAALPSIFPMPA